MGTACAKELKWKLFLKLLKNSKKASVTRAENGGIGIRSENCQGPDHVGYCRTE